MQKKSTFTTIIALLIVFLPFSVSAFGPTGSIIMGAISMLLVAVFKQWYNTSTGQWEFKGWNAALIVVNVGSFLITAIAMLTSYLQTNGVVIATPVAEFFVKTTIILNGVILAVNEILLKPENPQ